MNRADKLTDKQEKFVNEVATFLKENGREPRGKDEISSLLDRSTYSINDYQRYHVFIKHPKIATKVNETLERLEAEEKAKTILSKTERLQLLNKNESC